MVPSRSAIVNYTDFLIPKFKVGERVIIMLEGKITVLTIKEYTMIVIDERWKIYDYYYSFEEIENFVADESEIGSLNNINIQLAIMKDELGLSKDSDSDFKSDSDIGINTKSGIF